MNTKKYTKKYKNTKKSKKIINKKKTTKKLNRKFRKNKYKNFKGGMTAREKKAIKNILYALANKFFEMEDCIRTPARKERFIVYINGKFIKLQEKCEFCDPRINDIITNTSLLFNDIVTSDFTNYHIKYVEILNNLKALYELFRIRDTNLRNSLVTLQGRINPVAQFLHNSTTPPPHNSATPPPLPHHINSPLQTVRSPPQMHPSPPQITHLPLQLPGPMTPPVNQPLSPDSSSGMTPLRNLQSSLSSPRRSPRNLPTFARPIANRPNINRPVPSHLGIRYNAIFNQNQR